MLNLMMILALSSVNVPQTAGIFQPCIWPKCEKPAVEIAQFQPCIWPKCAKPEAESFGFAQDSEPAELLAQFETCVWPKKCEKSTLGI